MVDSKSIILNRKVAILEQKIIAIYNKYGMTEYTEVKIIDRLDLLDNIEELKGAVIKSEKDLEKDIETLKEYKRLRNEYMMECRRVE